MLDQLTGEVCDEGGVERGEVYEIALAGNATMTHLALGIDPEPLGVAPFIMASRSFEDLLATDLGVRVHPRARAYVFPALGAYVGGDIVAGRVASGMDRDRRIRLFIDIGTNCEILLGAGDRLLATAAPAGPAFEGAAIRCGMRAAPGAVEGVKISDDDVLLQVIGDVEPLGLAGSGLVDAVAALVGAGLMDASGRLIQPDAPRRACRAWPPACSRSARSGCSCCTSAAATPRTPCTCPSATSVSCSSPRPRSRPGGPCCWRSRA